MCLVTANLDLSLPLLTTSPMTGAISIDVFVHMLQVDEVMYTTGYSFSYMLDPSIPCNPIQFPMSQSMY